MTKTLHTYLQTFLYSGKQNIGKWDISKCLRGDRTFLLSGKWDILSSWGRNTSISGKWKNFIVDPDYLYIGIQPLILWDLRHPLGYGTWDRVIWELDSAHPRVWGDPRLEGG